MPIPDYVSPASIPGQITMFDFFRFLKGTGRSQRRNARRPRGTSDLSPFPRLLRCEALEFRTLLSVTTVGGAGTAAQHQTLGDLPAAAQQAISSAIGQD